MDFLLSFQEKTEEIYGIIFETENNDAKKLNFKGYLSSEIEQKTEIDEALFLSNNNKKPGFFIEICNKNNIFIYRNLQRWDKNSE